MQGPGSMGVSSQAAPPPQSLEDLAAQSAIVGPSFCPSPGLPVLEYDPLHVCLSLYHTFKLHL